MIIDATHARYVVLYQHLKHALDEADHSTLEAMSEQLRALPGGLERRVACLALHDVASGLPVRGQVHLKRLLDEASSEEEEFFLQVLEATQAAQF